MAVETEKESGPTPNKYHPKGSQKLLESAFQTGLVNTVRLLSLRKHNFYIGVRTPIDPIVARAIQDLLNNDIDSAINDFGLMGTAGQWSPN